MLILRLKLISGFNGGEETSRRFQNEQKLLAAIDHPNVARYFDSGLTDDGVPYLVMELVEGQPIDRYSDDRELSIREQAQLVLQVCEAVECVHRSAVLHRDLTPPNILVTSGGVPKLVDFGIAKSMDPVGGQLGDSEKTATDVILGTPAYLSPEQAAGGSRSATVQTDIYILGVLLYRLLTGRNPFRGVTRADLLDEILLSDPVPPSRLNSGVPRALETICLTCLRKDPKRRYASAARLADDVRSWLENRPIKAKPVSAFEKTSLWCQRRPAVAGLASVLGLTILISFIAVVTLWRYADAKRRNAEEDNRVAQGALWAIADFGGGVILSDDRPTRDDMTASLKVSRRYLLELAKRGPDDLQLLTKLGYISQYLARYCGREQRIQEAELFGRESVRYWDEIIRKCPSDLNARYRRWETLFYLASWPTQRGEELRNWQGVVDEGREAMHAGPRTDYHIMARARIALAAVLLERGEGRRALAVLEENLGMLRARFRPRQAS